MKNLTAACDVQITGVDHKKPKPRKPRKRKPFQRSFGKLFIGTMPSILGPTVYVGYTTCDNGVRIQLDKVEAKWLLKRLKQAIEKV